MFLWGCATPATLLFFSTFIHQSPSLALGRVSSLLYWSVSVLLLQVFCQELVLSNHNVHLSHSFRLHSVINIHTNYKSKLTCGSLSSGQVLSGKNSIKSTSQEPTVYKTYTRWKQGAVNTSQITFKREHLLNLWREWAFHTGVQIFSVCLTLSSYKPTPLCDLNHVSSDLTLQIGHSPFPSFQLEKSNKKQTKK